MHIERSQIKVLILPNICFFESNGHPKQVILAILRVSKRLKSQSSERGLSRRPTRIVSLVAWPQNAVSGTFRVYVHHVLAHVSCCLSLESMPNAHF